ncbi:hypothetical protein [Ruthenibacterium lactatiformans]|uniref:hypothetical protein n=1 Tax=Ruthenibacterium lactatiformans TaxID=1550024 RepID=UPI000B0F09D8|nr:hypothetical protein [Ruthenibacterium lactatiformans]MCQ5089538.1 hypothetical protein [Ruthenibacterium lactatiformans]
MERKQKQIKIAAGHLCGALPQFLMNEIVDLLFKSLLIYLLYTSESGCALQLGASKQNL